MKYNFKLGDIVRLYRESPYMIFHKGDVGVIERICGDKYAIVRLENSVNGFESDCIQLSYLAYVKE